MRYAMKISPLTPGFLTVSHTTQPRFRMRLTIFICEGNIKNNVSPAGFQDKES